MPFADDPYLRAYRAFLAAHNDLRDCARRAGDGLDRLRNAELAAFRDDPALAWVDRPIPGRRLSTRVYRGSYAPTQTRLAAHLICQGQRTVWATNALGADRRTLLMLVDLDNKDGAAAVDRAAGHVVDRYLGGAGIAEASTGGRGRHVYFKCDVAAHSAQEVWHAFTRLAGVVRADEVIRDTGVTTDAVFLGLPTVWERKGGSWAVRKRGTPFRLPYVEDEDLGRFEALPALDLAHFARQSPLGTALPSIKPEDIRITGRGPLPPGADEAGAAPADGLARRFACWREVMGLTGGRATADDCLAHYHARYPHTGDGRDDVRRRLADFGRLARLFGPKFRPEGCVSDNSDAHPFRRGEYLPLVEAFVPAAEFAWARRNRLDHQRLADLVGVKVQDAFFAKADDRFFARASRDATVANFRALRAKGLVGWICNPNQYARLLAIALKYGLLAELAPAVRSWRPDGRRRQGLARMIGPGPGLEAEHARFTQLYEAWATRQRAALN